MFGHFPQAVYIGFSVLSRNDEARSPRLTMEVMKQGTGGELRDESWRGTGDKEKHTGWWREYLLCVELLTIKNISRADSSSLLFTDDLTSRKASSFVNISFSTFPSCIDFHANQRTSVGWLIRDDKTCKKMNEKLYGNWRMLLVFLESWRFFTEIFF